MRAQLCMPEDAGDAVHYLCLPHAGFVLASNRGGRAMKLGVCAPVGEVAGLSDVPVDYLEESVQRFLVPERPREAFAENLRRARSLPVPIEAANSLLPPDLVLVQTPRQQVDAVRLEWYIRTALERAEQSGIRVIVFGSGAARACPPDWDRADAERQIGEHLARWSVWARAYGVTLALEPLRYDETNTLNTVAEGGALVRGIAASGATLLADLYHMACNGEPPDSILPWASLLAHTHVAEQEGRTAPGRHGDDFRPYLAALQRAGYDGRMSIECTWHEFPAEVGPAMAALRRQWLEVEGAQPDETT